MIVAVLIVAVVLAICIRLNAGVHADYGRMLGTEEGAQAVERAGNCGAGCILALAVLGVLAVLMLPVLMGGG